WLILGRVSPQHQLLGTILYIWNPVVLVEFAGEGHNDPLAIFFLLLSIYLCIRRKIGEGVIATGIGALIKIVGVVFVPVEAVYVWRTRTADGRRRILEAAALGAAAVAAIAIVAYAPLWVGRATFDGLRAHARPNAMEASTPSVLYLFLTRSHSEQASALVIALLMGGSFIAYTAAVAMRIRDARTFVAACGRIAIVYLVIAPG